MKTCRTNGSDSLRGFAEVHIVGRHLAPAETLLAFFRDDFLQGFLEAAALLALIRQENHADAIFAGVRQVKAQSFAGILEKSVRHLHQNAGAVAGVFLAAASAAMIEILQDHERLLDDLVRLFALDIDDKADAAGIVFETRIVKPLFGWQTR